jgi:hypothetical protein
MLTKRGARRALISPLWHTWGFKGENPHQYLSFPSMWGKLLEYDRFSAKEKGERGFKGDE